MLGKRKFVLPEREPTMTAVPKPKPKTRRLNIHIVIRHNILGSIVALSLWVVVLLPLYFLFFK